AASLGQRKASQWPRERLRRLRTPLHGTRELHLDGCFEVSESYGLPKDAVGERFLSWIERVAVSDGSHFLRRQTGRRHSEGGRAGYRSGFHARPHGEPLARFLAHLP